jgi:hypothetical protein
MRSDDRPRAELRRFLRRLPLAIVGAALLWLAVRPIYDPALAWVTQGLSRLTEQPAATQIVVLDGTATIGRRDLRADSARFTLAMAQVDFNLVPFLALMLALPGWVRRDGLMRLATALLMLFMAHALTLLWQVQFLFATSLGPWSQATYSSLERNVIGSLKYFFDIPLTFTLPLLLWVGFFAAQVFPMLGIELPKAAAPPSPARRHSS